MPIISQVGRKSTRVRMLYIGIAVFLWLGVAIHMFPFYMMLSTSLKSSTTIRQQRNKATQVAWPAPDEMSTASYELFLHSLDSGPSQNMLFRYSLGHHLLNSVIIALGIVVLQLPVTAFAAYAVSRLLPKGFSRFLFFFFIGTMMIPGQISFIPRFMILSHFPFPTTSAPMIGDVELPSLRLLGTYWGVILPGAFNAFNFLLLKGYFDTLPKDLMDAARIDGASEMGVIRHVTIPLSQPILAVVTYFSFRAAWNAFMGPWLVLMSEQGKWPLSVIMFKLQRTLLNPPQMNNPAVQMMMEEGVGPNALMAMSVIESIPIVVLFLIFREYLMRGIKLQGFK
ncbi:MAG: carbohydrate ABC transporter permease [Hyphomicrobiaceae bacterium]|nr:carbohydrate ABC transporter permease [Hyphomicrobiaceae bacterium]